MVAIVDYGVGNLFSLRSSLVAIGADAVVTSDEAVLRSADKIILPGVGAFGDAKAKLDATGLVPVLQEEANIEFIIFGRGASHGVKKYGFTVNLYYVNSKKSINK